MSGLIRRGSVINQSDKYVDSAVAIAVPENTWIPLGDSITANAWSTASGTTLARSNGVVTVTQSSHPFMTSMTVLVEQMTDSTYNGVYTVTRTGTNTYTYACAGADGSTSGGFIRCPYQLADNGWVNWANFLLGNRLTMLWNAGIGGNTTAQMLARLYADVISRSPGYCSVMGGINDLSNVTTQSGTTTNGSATITLSAANPIIQVGNTITGTGIPANATVTAISGAALTISSAATASGTVTLSFQLSASQIFANLQAIYARLRTAGIRVIALTVLPLESGHVNFSTANTQKILDINRLIRSECLAYPDMIYVDSHAAVVDATSSTGAARTGYLSSTDHIHPSALGSWAVGVAFYNATVNAIPAKNTLISSRADNIGTSAVNTNIWQWLPGTNSGGTLGGTATGTAPAGFKVQSAAGSPTVVASAPARTVAADGDDYGYNCRAEFTPAAANDWCQITQASSGWAANAAVGNAYYLECAINVTNVSGSNLSKFYAQLQVVIDSVNYFFYGLSAAATTFPTSDFKGVIRTVPFVLTGTTLSNIVFSINAIASAAGTAVTIDVGRVQIRQVPSGSAITF